MPVPSASTSTRDFEPTLSTYGITSGLCGGCSAAPCEDDGPAPTQGTMKRMTSPGVSVVVPVYNGEATLAELGSGLARVLPGAAPACEVILVDDGRRDRSAPIVNGL